MIAVGEITTWLALCLAAFNTGVFAVRARDPDAGRRAGSEWSLIAQAGALAVTLAVLAGTLLRGVAPLALLSEGAPIEVSAAYRLAALWSTPRGALLTLALLLSSGGIAVGLSERAGARAANRGAATASGIVMVLLAAAVLSLPPFAISGGPATSGNLPVHVLHPAAALAPLFALGSLASALMLGVLIVSSSGAPPAVTNAAWQRIAVAGWVLATGALAAEQSARLALGVTAREAVIPGGSATGLVLWIALSAVIHARVRALVVPGFARENTFRHSGWVAHAAHSGAALVIAAFGAHAAAARHQVTLEPGRAVELGDVFGRQWRLVNQGVSHFDAPGSDVAALAIEVDTPGGRRRLVSTELRQYIGRAGEPVGGRVGRRGIVRGVVQDLRVVLDETAPGDVATVRVAFVPLAALWPVGVTLLLVAGLRRSLGPAGLPSFPGAQRTARNEA